LLLIERAQLMGKLPVKKWVLAIKVYGKLKTKSVLMIFYFYLYLIIII